MCRKRVLILGLTFVLTGGPVVSLVAGYPAPSPVLAHATTPQAPLGWKTYVSSSLHLAVDYPPDWTVRVENSSAVFSSSEILRIRLDPSAPGSGNEIIQPNTRCSATINPHGIRIRTCSATIGAAIDAYLDLRSAGGPSDATLSTRNRPALGVLNALAASARIVP